MFSSNSQLAEHDVPTQQRMLTFLYRSLQTENDDPDLPQKYQDAYRGISCVVPDIMAMRHGGVLDVKYINEVFQFIKMCSPSCLSPRIAHNLKKPMYLLLLVFKWIDLGADLMDKYIFDYMETLIRQYVGSSAQKDLWTKFFYWFNQTLNSCNRLSGHVYGSIHW